MASPDEYDDVPMLPVSDTSSSSRTRPFTSSPEPPFSLPPGGSSDSVGASSSQPERNHDYNCKASQIPTPRVSATSDSTSHNALDDDAKGWARRFATSIDKYLPRIMNPHSKDVQKRNHFFAYSCLFSIFVDPFFFYPIEVNKEDKCMKINWPMANSIVAIRCFSDLLYLVNILLQCRLAYVAPGSTVVGAGQLVNDPIKIVCRYFRGKFIHDFLIMIPFPQILIAWLIPYVIGISEANDTKNFLRIVVLIQCTLKIHRLIFLLAGQRPTGFIFESSWDNFFINLATFMLAGHIVGSCWYLFGLQRVNQCLRDACGRSDDACEQLIDCGSEYDRDVLDAWKGNVKASACFEENGFHYGIYWKAVNLTHESNILTRYSYSLFWGIQQISTLAGNQVPSYYFWEVLFTMAIIGLGLFLFALLIGNMQNFLQSLGRRNTEMTLRRRDMDQWMSHRQFPESIKMRVQESDLFHWTSTGGVNEELFFENMPDDLQRDIRRHLFAVLKNKVRMFSKMDEPILDAIRERLKQRTYLKSSMVLVRKGLVNKMVFIVRGKMESIGEDGSTTPLLEGDVCGEELLTWCHETSSGNTDGTRIKMPSKGLLSNRDVWCVTNVEAFSLSVADLEDIVSLFPTLEIPKES
ncbi:hypothetical protein N665_0290s0021 [Sinapis alba]|nr:hypothetical protein N665_0290s0021 [Sinapis alba]